MGAILGLLGQLFKLLIFWFDPERQKKIRKAAIFDELKRLEDEYGLALMEGNPTKAAKLDHKLRELRQRIKYVEATD